MNYSEKDMIRSALLPLLLGASGEALTLSFRIYLRFGVTSYICDEGQSIIHTLNPATRFLDLGARSEPEILLESLVAISERGDYLPIIIPCDDFYRSFTARFRDTLETRFIISDRKRFFSERPMSVF